LQGTLSFAKTKETLEKFPAKEIKERKLHKIEVYL
jgi:hypothetical protein